MYDKLRQVIKTDSDSQQIFGEFLDEFNAKEQWKKRIEIRRSRIAAFILACAALVSLFFIVFSYTETRDLQREVFMLKSRLEDCQNQ